MLNSLPKKECNSWVGVKKGGAFTLITLSLLLGACTPEPEATVPETEVDTTLTETDDTDVEDVVEDTEELIGEMVTVTGEVEEDYGINTFVIEETGEIFGDKVLVINTAATEPILEEQNVRVTGEVRELVVAEFERDYDLTWEGDILRTIEAEYVGQPVIVADAVEVLDIP
ncbi:MAG: hypothetical protein RIE73_35610 [Coleofasciculus sp. C1-SOL-03]|uniref:hypothetical protein n=1 Tax=Coleofasciculus sp. C1-SOL-03 TaxID=3069522 RepID=UPI0032FD835D